MTRGVAYAVVTVLVLLSGAPVWAQHPGPGHGPQPPGDTQPMGGQSHMMHMHMCREMMGVPMSSDPKQQAETMAMRGEMMKAMGDIMLKYAERMRMAK